MLSTDTDEATCSNQNITEEEDHKLDEQVSETHKYDVECFGGDDEQIEECSMKSDENESAAHHGIDVGNNAADETPDNELNTIDNQQNDEIDDGAIEPVDDDDFGNFEEATTNVQSTGDGTENNEQNPAQFPSFDTNPSESPFPRIYDLLSDDKLWSTEEKPDSCLKTNVEICDFFQRLEVCDGESDNLDEFLSKSIWLWSNLCYVEEAIALKFVWNNSVTQKKFLSALGLEPLKVKHQQQMDEEKNDSFQTHSADQSLSTSQKFEEDISEPSFATTSFDTPMNSTEVDSLSVPPVTFDWQSSGLSNPLKGSSISEISAVLECDFFNIDSGDSSQLNGQSILERDLDSLGLSDSNLSVQMKAPVDVEELIRKCAVSEKLKHFNSKNGSEYPETNSISNCDIKFKEVNELSIEARTLYDKLPDYTYMLSPLLVFSMAGEEK